jgi:hypothetical protein
VFNWCDLLAMSPVILNVVLVYTFRVDTETLLWKSRMVSLMWRSLGPNDRVYCFLKVVLVYSFQVDTETLLWRAAW